MLFEVEIKIEWINRSNYLVKYGYNIYQIKSPLASLNQLYFYLSIFTYILAIFNLNNLFKECYIFFRNTFNYIQGSKIHEYTKNQ